MLGVFLAPFSPSINKTPNEVSLEIQKIIINAQTTETWYLLVDGQVFTFSSQAECTQARVIFSAQGATVGDCTQTAPTAASVLYPDFESKLRECRVTRGTFVMGCLIHIMYFFFVTIPSFLLGIAGKFLDFISAMTLSDYIYGLPFVDNIWSLIRDFANIFFILILLYAAFQIILGLGHGGGKKMIASVILMALLINFSLFISRVIIDTSNVLAQIFYNKIECKLEKINPDGTKEVRDCAQSKIIDSPEEINKIGLVERPISESFVAALDINQFFKGSWLNSLPKNDADGDGIDENNYWETKACPNNGQAGVPNCYQVTLNNYLAAALIAVYGIFIWPMVWIFFVIGLSLLSRLIMLILYMIVSPIAFSTAAIPGLSNKDTIGFNSWIKKILETSFMATILMAIFYLIAKIMQADIFEGIGSPDQKVIEAIIIIFIPFAIIFIFLKKGSEYAKKASGEFTGALLSGAKILGGLALGGAALGAAGAAWAGRNTVGSVTRYIQDDSKRRKDSVGNLKQNWQSWSLGKKLNPLAYLKQGGKTIASTVAEGAHRAYLPTGMGGRTNSIGEMMQKKEKQFDKGKSATSTLDSAAAHEFGGKFGYAKDVKYEDLRDDAEREKVKEAVDKDMLSKKAFGQKYDGITDAEQKAAVDRAYTNLSTNRNNYVNPNTGEINITVDVISRDPANPNNFIRTPKTIKGQGGEENEKLYGKSSMRGELISGMRKGSWNVQNLSEAPSLVKNPIKIAAGAAAIFGAPILAAGMFASSVGGLRAVLKKGSSEYGTVNKDFLKDLGGILTGAINSSVKNASFKVDLKDVGSGHGGGDHGGGGGGHH